uniref:Uncharacterized protein n=1 Tax=Ditylenchus dipsaci TaxID=166011 RepID=A0A915D9E6_9BILA
MPEEFWEHSDEMFVEDIEIFTLIPRSSVVVLRKGCNSEQAIFEYQFGIIQTNKNSSMDSPQKPELRTLSPEIFLQNTTNEWSVVKVEGMLPPSRDGHTEVMHNHTMFIFGGFEESNHRFSQETYAYDFNTNTWHQVNTQGDPPQHRDFHTACVLDSKMYIFGGRSDEMGQHHSSNDKYCDQLMCLDSKLIDGRWSRPRRCSQWKTISLCSDPQRQMYMFEPSLESLCSEAVVRMDSTNDMTIYCYTLR